METTFEHRCTNPANGKPTYFELTAAQANGYGDDAVDAIVHGIEDDCSGRLEPVAARLGDVLTWSAQ